MLRIKHNILDQISPAGTKAILGLDLTKAFDNLSHIAILEALQQLGVGAKIYNYVKDFLSSRTANLHLGGAKVRHNSARQPRYTPRIGSVTVSL